MKIIHLNGYSRSELDGFKPIVVRNILESIRNLIHAIHRFHIPFSDEETEECSRRVLSVVEDLQMPSLTPELAGMIERVWRDEAAKKALEKSSEFYMMDTAP